MFIVMQEHVTQCIDVAHLCVSNSFSIKLCSTEKKSCIKFELHNIIT